MFIIHAWRRQPKSASRTQTSRGLRSSSVPTQNWFQTKCPDFVTKDKWPPSSLDLNHGLPCLGYCWRPISIEPSKPEDDRGTQETMQMIWDQGLTGQSGKSCPVLVRGGLGRLPVHGPGFKFQGWPGNLGQDSVRVCFEINFADRKEGSMVSSIICDHWWVKH